MCAFSASNLHMHGLLGPQPDFGGPVTLLLLLLVLSLTRGVGGLGEDTVRRGNSEALSMCGTGRVSTAALAARRGCWARLPTAVATGVS